MQSFSLSAFWWQEITISLETEPSSPMTKPILHHYHFHSWKCDKIESLSYNFTQKRVWKPAEISVSSKGDLSDLTDRQTDRQRSHRNLKMNKMQKNILYFVLFVANTVSGLNQWHISDNLNKQTKTDPLLQSGCFICPWFFFSAQTPATWPTTGMWPPGVTHAESLCFVI